jgi:hypothetical protein
LSVSEVRHAPVRHNGSIAIKKLDAHMAATKAPIADMRPTQLTLGLSEVEERAAKIGAMTPSEREAHLERKAIPHVLGPGKKIYIVDHHHLARALWSLKFPEAVLGDRVADWSGLEPKAFWRMMESKGYCWPIDADGNRRRFHQPADETLSEGRRISLPRPRSRAALLLQGIAPVPLPAAMWDAVRARDNQSSMTIAQDDMGLYAWIYRLASATLVHIRTPT